MRAIWRVLPIVLVCLLLYLTTGGSAATQNGITCRKAFLGVWGNRIADIWYITLTEGKGGAILKKVAREASFPKESRRKAWLEIYWNI